MNYKNSKGDLVGQNKRYKLWCSLGAIAYGLPLCSFAFEGDVGFDSTSFFYSSSDRGTSSTTLKAGFEATGDQKYFHEQTDATFYTFVDNNPTLNFESKQTYLSTQKGTFGHVEYTLGRRIYEWSKVDQDWSMMSLWSPHFTWDPIYPETIGLTGAFITYDSQNIHWMVYGSPIAIPERGTPLVAQNGTITSPNPFWQPLPTTQMVMGTPTTIQYNLLMPPLQDILFRPNFAARLKVDLPGGFWASFNSGILPVYQTQLAAQPYLGPNGTIQVNIIPEFPMRSLTTAEAGVVAPDKDWDMWFSASYERPFNFTNESDWLNPVITPATIIATGSDVNVTKNFVFHGGVLFIHEDSGPPSTNLTGVSVSLPSRFPLKQGFEISGDWHFSDYTQSKLQWIQDLQEQNQFFSLQIQHRFPKTRVEVGAGADAFIAQTTTGWVGQYYGDDRIRGWLKYAF